MRSSQVSYALHVSWYIKADSGQVSSMPDGEDHPETWVFHMAMAFHGDPVNSLSYPERLALVKARAETMGEPAKSAFQWIPDNTLVHNADISYWITEPWNNHGGRVTLAGKSPFSFLSLLKLR